MQSPCCAHHNPAEAKYCGECGVRLGYPCPACRAANAPDNLFCWECGRPLAGGSPALRALSPTAPSPNHGVEAVQTLPGPLAGAHKRLMRLWPVADAANRPFFYLLASTALYIVLEVLLGRHQPVTFALDIALSMIMAAVLFAIGHHRFLTAVAFVIFVILPLIDILAAITNHPMETTAVFVARTALLLALSVITIIIALTSVLKSERVTPDTIYGAAYVYLVVGFAWGLFLGLLELVQPGSFHGLAPLTARSYDRYNYAQSTNDFIHLSYVTITTVGYGDITPATLPARAMVWMEAMTGQIYLAVLVARLVSLQIIHSGMDDSTKSS